MMKRTLIAFTTCTLMVLACAAPKNAVTYEFPPEMSETVRGQFLKDWEKGKVLYGINCARCHNTKVKGREMIPDFSQEKLVGYELRIMNARHEGDLPDEKVTAEELVMINTFLTYKKKSGISPVR
jgi:hypothetical protein